MLDVRLLQTFCVVAEARSMSTAAQRLGYSQPTVTQQVQRLEHLIGGRLLARSGGGVILTDTGRHVLPLARVVVAAVGELYRLHPATNSIDAFNSALRPVPGTHEVSPGPHRSRPGRTTQGEAR